MVNKEMLIKKGWRFDEKLTENTDRYLMQDLVLITNNETGRVRIKYKDKEILDTHVK